MYDRDLRVVSPQRSAPKRKRADHNCEQNGRDNDHKRQPNRLVEPPRAQVTVGTSSP
eukprot:CAMPEP_0180035556 /NCGR_PEP_ID=MMETSP0984-20121128/30343_1 /TAXON_ID=483367 /ORGANISM="non described non described, Strain CCMP 2436" /LENGTH=56 /DNA_ID=CAMNT_0021961445 /DNA_START=232 /DNA_END=402 /DNA_ORIENTATION=-